VSQPGTEPSADSTASESTAPHEKSAAWADAVGRVGTDWWATIVAGVVVLLAVTNVLPKIPW
jgi:uncharacterized membrane protein YdfJ with MMPL/SSD domain